MSKTVAAAKQPTMIEPATTDSNTWRPIITPLLEAKKPQASARSTVKKRHPRDLSADTILNDRLG